MSGALIARGVPNERIVIRPVDVELGVDVKLSPSGVTGMPALSVMKAPGLGVAMEPGVAIEPGVDIEPGVAMKLGVPCEVDG